MPTHVTPETNEHPDEVQLETLLRGLFERGEARSSPAPTAALPEIAELRDTARRLRAASQWVPLPDGRLAVRRALMALAQHDPNRAIPGRAAWRRAGLWLSTLTGLVAVIGAFGLGAGALDPLIPPSSPAYGVRLALVRVWDTLIPSQPGASAYALTFEFSAAQVPSEPGATAMTTGRLGGLPATLSLTTASGCQAGATCGKFVVSVAGLATTASAKFGELRGTFACEAGGCILTTAQMTGVFARMSASAISVNTMEPSAGRLGSHISSLGEWVSTVASASDTLSAGGMLPGGVTASDLAQQAATNETHDHVQRGGVGQGQAAPDHKSVDAKRDGGTGKPGGRSKDGGVSGIGTVEDHGTRGPSATKGNDHPSTSTGPAGADTHHGPNATKGTDHPSTSTGPAGADIQHGPSTIEDKDHPSTSTGPGIADIQHGPSTIKDKDHPSTSTGPGDADTHHGPNITKDKDHPSAPGGTLAGEKVGDKNSGAAGGKVGGAGAGSNHGGAGTGSAGGRSGEGGSGSGDHGKEDGGTESH